MSLDGVEEQRTKQADEAEAEGAKARNRYLGVKTKYSTIGFDR
jgi:hypothetical protein